ncbi:hypothetical protein PUN28_001235 [Cardiocondyla obscurior]|uniref:Uncharacterized protein n=1 Tax=Cardiocondyla obscurior TaxID=286306 RepID=A0AAW2H3W8_9HYME
MCGKSAPEGTTHPRDEFIHPAKHDKCKHDGLKVRSPLSEPPRLSTWHLNWRRLATRPSAREEALISPAFQISEVCGAHHYAYRRQARTRGPRIASPGNVGCI